MALMRRGCFRRVERRGITKTCTVIPTGIIGESGLCVYPESAYVDAAGIDLYSDATGSMPYLWGDLWSAFAALGKPLDYDERGPTLGNQGTSLVFQNFIPGIVANAPSSNPAVSMFMAWGGSLAIVNNLGASALVGDANATNQNDVSRALECMAGAATYSARLACVTR